MRFGTMALAASILTGALYLSAGGASALPAPSRADITSASTDSIAQEVRHYRRGYRGYRGYRGRYYRPYAYYGSPYYYRRPYYRGYRGYPYYRRPGFGIYLGF